MKFPSISFRLPILYGYLLKEFFSTLFLCFLGSTSLFLVFDFFERMRDFVKEGATILQVMTYLALKCPLVLQLPQAVIRTRPRSRR